MTGCQSQSEPDDVAIDGVSSASFQQGDESKDSSAAAITLRLTEDDVGWEQLDASLSKAGIDVLTLNATPAQLGYAQEIVDAGTEFLHSKGARLVGLIAADEAGEKAWELFARNSVDIQVGVLINATPQPMPTFTSPFQTPVLVLDTTTESNPDTYSSFHDHLSDIAYPHEMRSYSDNVHFAPATTQSDQNAWSDATNRTQAWLSQFLSNEDD